MLARNVVVLMSLLCTACGTYSPYQKFEPKSKGLNKAASLLEGKNPRAAQEELLKLVPAPARLLLETTEKPATENYVFDLSAAMSGVNQGANILSMYATAEAAVASVGTLDIIIELVKIDKEKKDAASLHLTATSDNDAIRIFFPAMPLTCQTNSSLVQRRLDLAVDVTLATAVLNGFPIKDYMEIKEKQREMRATLANSNLLNQSIFSLVNFICPILQFDTSHDFVVDEAEAAAMSDEDATNLYQRMEQAIDAIQAMVDANPGDKNLEKALARCKSYKDQIDALPADVSLPNKVRAFLVTQTKKS